jgi:hypothetical protein
MGNRIHYFSIQVLMKILNLIIVLILSSGILGCATLLEGTKVGGSSAVGSERDRPWQYRGNQFEFEGW